MFWFCFFFSTTQQGQKTWGTDRRNIDMRGGDVAEV